MAEAVDSVTRFPFFFGYCDCCLLLHATALSARPCSLSPSPIFFSFPSFSFSLLSLVAPLGTNYLSLSLHCIPTLVHHLSTNAGRFSPLDTCSLLIQQLLQRHTQTHTLSLQVGGPCFLHIRISVSTTAYRISVLSCSTRPCRRTPYHTASASTAPEAQQISLSFRFSPTPNSIQ